MAEESGISPTAELELEVSIGSVASEYAAEAWAVGERAGVPVGETDQTYHNNAKYYATAAGDEADDAEAWANGTRNGTEIGSSDEAYHKNAKYYRDMSQADANTAAGSAQTAAAARDAASGYAQGAETAQAAAEAAAREAAETVVAAQGPGLVYVDSEGIMYVLE